MRLFYAVCLLGLSLFFMANKSGRGNQTGVGATLAPGETGQTCGQQGCHSANVFFPEIDLSIHDAAGDTVHQYLPGATYEVRYQARATQGFPAGYGFMMVSLDEDDNAIETWDSIPPFTRVISLGGRQYVEHTNRIHKDTVLTFAWSVPEDANGDITFYAASALVNGNNSSSGDRGIAIQHVLPIVPGASSNELSSEKIFQIFPNPASDQLRIENDGQGQIEYSVYNQNGALIKNGHYQNHIDVANLPTGTYFLAITGATRLLPFFKI